MIIKPGRIDLERIEEALNRRLPVDIKDLRELLADAGKKLGRAFVKKSLRKSRERDRRRTAARTQDKVATR